MLYSIVLLLVLSLFGCSGTGGSGFKEEVYEYHGIEIPSILGQPQYSDEEIAAFDGITSITTLADLIAYYDLNSLEFNSSDAIANNICYVLKGDYDETGILEAKYEDREYNLVYIKKDDKLIPFDAFMEYKNDRKWMEGYKGEKIFFDSYEEMLDAIKENYTLYGKNIDEITYTVKNRLVNDFVVSAENIRCREDLAERAMEGYTKHYASEYSDEEIQKMVEEDLTLEEAADRLHTVTDAVNYIRARGIKAAYELPNINQRYNGVEWVWGNSAEFTFNEKIYECSGIANLFNCLMADDFDSEGYVFTKGHVTNYFEDDGLYYYCDMSGIEDPGHAAVNPYHPKYITDDIQEAIAMAQRANFNFVFVCQYEHTGEIVPTGFYANDPDRDAYRLVVSDEIEGKYIQLYYPEEREICYERAPQGAEKIDDYVWLRRLGYKY